MRTKASVTARDSSGLNVNTSRDQSSAAPVRCCSRGQCTTPLDKYNARVTYQLFDDAASVLVLPPPHLLDELLAAQVVS